MYHRSETVIHILIIYQKNKSQRKLLTGIQKAQGRCCAFCLIEIRKSKIKKTFQYNYILLFLKRQIYLSHKSIQCIPT